jgi:hypothetical protein
MLYQLSYVRMWPSTIAGPGRFNPSLSLHRSTVAVRTPLSSVPGRGEHFIGQRCFKPRAVLTTNRPRIRTGDSEPLVGPIIVAQQLTVRKSTSFGVLDR